MPISHECPACQTRVTVPTGAGGRAVACPACGAAFAPKRRKSEGAAAGHPRRKRAEAGGPNPSLLLLGIAAAVGVLVLGGGAFVVYRMALRKPPEVAVVTKPADNGPLPAAALAIAPTPAEPAAPARPPERSPPPAIPPATGAEWAGGSPWEISHTRSPTFGPTGCPTAIAGPQIWDLARDKPTGELDGYEQERGHRILSADGRWFACASSPKKTEAGRTDVWSTVTGLKAFSIPGAVKDSPDPIAFAGENLLFIGSRNGSQLAVWDTARKQSVKVLAVAGKRVAVSPDGRFVASAGKDHIVVQKVGDGRAVATLVPQAAKGHAGGGAFALAWLNHLSFSPDGAEVAMTSTHPEPHFTVWRADGKRVLTMDLPSSFKPGYESALDWLPDGGGWLVGNSLIDRATGRVLVRVDSPSGSPWAPRLIDGQRIAVAVEGHLNLVPIPWGALRGSLAKLAEGGPAPLSPAAAVSVKVDVTGARGDAAETQRVLTEAITARLARLGIRAGEGGSTVIRIRLAEQAGETLPIMQQASPFSRGGAPTGKTATEAKGAIVVEILAAGRAAPLWHAAIDAGSARSFREAITDAAIRKSMLDDAAHRIGELDMPYYIPADPAAARLPAVLE